MVLSIHRDNLLTAVTLGDGSVASPVGLQNHVIAAGSCRLAPAAAAAAT